MCKKNYDVRQIQKLFSLIIKSYGRKFSEQQIKGMMYILDRIFSREPGKHVLSVPCGIGKTTIIKVIIAHNLIKSIPTLIITDRLDRLEEYTSDASIQHYVEKACKNNRYESEVVNLSADAETPIDQTADKMIVLLSLQKYNGLSDEQRKMLYQYVDSTSRIMIVDEALISHDIVKINNAVLGHMEGTLRDAAARLEGNFEDFQNAIKVFSAYTKYLQGEMINLEQLAENVTLPYLSGRDSFTGMGANSEEEKAFRDTIQKNMNTIMALDDEFKTHYEALLNMLNKNVAFFVSFGKNESRRKKEGNRYFLTKIDYQNRLPNDISVWILDGTVEIDIQYEGGAYMLEQASELHRSLENVTIYFHRIATNSTRLKGKENKDYCQRLLEIIKGTIFSRFPGNDIMVSAYKDKDIIKLIKQILSVQQVATYGDITGKNDWRSCHVLVKTGILRKPTIVSLIDAIEYYPHIWDELMQGQASANETIDLLNKISADNSNKWKEEIEKTVVSRWMVDFIQEMYRLCIRNYNCTDEVEVHIYSNARKPGQTDVDIYTKFFDAVESYITEKGGNVVSCGWEQDLSDLIRRNRKSASGSGQIATYGKVRNCLEKMPKRTVFTLHQLAEWSGVTYDSLKQEKRRNKAFAGLLSEMATGNKIGNCAEYRKQ